MNRRVTRLLMVLVLLAGASAADAQRGGAGRGRGGPPPPQGRGPGVEERMGQIMRQQLQLTDAQARQLGETNLRFRERRRELGEVERNTRRVMREILVSGDTARAEEMGRLISRLHEIERRQLQLREEEQRELATFLTPFQRARYIAVEEQLQRLMEEQAGRGGRGRGGPPPPPPGAR